jgi:pseudouridine synthase
MTERAIVNQISKFVFSIILTQGLNRQIRRMCEFLDYRVVTLKRIRILNIHLNDLEVGKWRNLRDKELKTLKASLQKS